MRKLSVLTVMILAFAGLVNAQTADILDGPSGPIEESAPAEETSPEVTSNYPYCNDFIAGQWRDDGNRVDIDIDYNNGNFGGTYVDWRYCGNSPSTLFDITVSVEPSQNLDIQLDYTGNPGAPNKWCANTTMNMAFTDPACNVVSGYFEVDPAYCQLCQTGGLGTLQCNPCFTNATWNRKPLPAGTQLTLPQTNPSCDPTIGPSCSSNFVQANQSDTTTLFAKVTPVPPEGLLPMLFQINAPGINSPGTVPSMPAAASSTGIGSITYTGGMIQSSAETDTIGVKVSIGATSRSALNPLYQYNGFNFHQVPPSDADFANGAALPATGTRSIQNIFQEYGSFLANTYFWQESGTRPGALPGIAAFYDKNGNGIYDAGDTPYNMSLAQQTGLIQLGKNAKLESVSVAVSKAAIKARINPELLIASLQKENQAIKNMSESQLPSQIIFNSLMNCAPHISTFNGLSRQIVCGANTFANQYYMKNTKSEWNGRKPPSFPFFMNIGSQYLLHSPTGAGGQPTLEVAFNVLDASTYAQYQFTPYVDGGALGGAVKLWYQVWTGFGSWD